MPRSGSKKACQFGPAPLPPPPTLSEYIDRLLGAVDADVETCACLAVSTSPEAQATFCHRVRDTNVPPGFPQGALPTNLFPQFMSWAGQIGSIVRPFSAPNIAAAKAYRTLQKDRLRWSKNDFIEAARLNPRAVDKTAFLKSIPRFAANPLQNPYPPKSTWIAESSSILDCNRQFIEKEPLHDIRDWRRPIQLLDINKLALDVGATESAQVYDAVGGHLVGMVVRDVCKSEEAVSLVDDTVQRIVETRITSRKGDVGSIPLFGHSAGPLSAMASDWVKNLRGSLSEDQCNEEDVKGANSFALFWNMVRTIAPEEVVEDFENFLRISRISRMDARGNLPHNPETGRGDYRIDLPSGLSFTFRGAELAPPAGVCARNYARYMHTEAQPHAYAVAWTTSRKVDSSASSLDNGGHFFLASHGVRFQASANSLLIWRPRLLHGTSLPLQHPRDPSSTQFCQQGISFVTSRRLPEAWRRYQENKKIAANLLPSLFAHPGAENLAIADEEAAGSASLPGSGFVSHSGTLSYSLAESLTDVSRSSSSHPARSSTSFCSNPSPSLHLALQPQSLHGEAEPAPASEGRPTRQRQPTRRYEDFITTDDRFSKMWQG